MEKEIKIDNKEFLMKEVSFITESNWKLWQQIDKQIDDSQTTVLAEAIVNRVADLYEEWYKTLEVDQLFGEDTVSD